MLVFRLIRLHCSRKQDVLGDGSDGGFWKGTCTVQKNPRQTLGPPERRRGPGVQGIVLTPEMEPRLIKLCPSSVFITNPPQTNRTSFLASRFFHSLPRSFAPERFRVREDEGVCLCCYGSVRSASASWLWEVQIRLIFFHVCNVMTFSFNGFTFSEHICCFIDSSLTCTNLWDAFVQVTYKWSAIEATVDQGEAFENKCLKLSSCSSRHKRPEVAGAWSNTSAQQVTFWEIQDQSIEREKENLS